MLALLNKVSLARQKSEQANAESPLMSLEPNKRTQALSPLSYEEQELLRQIRETKLGSEDKPHRSTKPRKVEDYDEADAVHRRLRDSGGHGSRYLKHFVNFHSFLAKSNRFLILFNFFKFSTRSKRVFND